MKDQILKIEENAKLEIEKAETLQALNEARVKFLGKKGELTAVLRGMGALSAEERPIIGSFVNETRDVIENLIEEKENKLKQKILNNEVKIIGENKNEIYYTLNDEFYKYTPSYGSEKIFYNYELAYNNDNSIFIYIK